MVDRICIDGTGNAKMGAPGGPVGGSGMTSHRARSLFFSDPRCKVHGGFRIEKEVALQWIIGTCVAGRTGIEPAMLFSTGKKTGVHRYSTLLIDQRL